MTTRCGPSFPLDGKPKSRAEGEGAREFHDLLIKVTNFEPISDYRLGPDGRPRLASQTADSKGSSSASSAARPTKSSTPIADPAQLPERFTAGSGARTQSCQIEFARRLRL